MVSRAMRFTPSMSPMGMPTIWAATKPVRMRIMESRQESQ